MKKKALVLILCLALVATFAIVLAGCNQIESLLGGGGSYTGTYYKYVNGKIDNGSWIKLEKSKWSDSDETGGRLEYKDGTVYCYAEFFGEEDVLFWGTVKDGCFHWTLDERLGYEDYYKMGAYKGENVGDSTGGDTHTHEWASAWSKNDSKHWKVCSGCDEKKDEAAHTYTNGICVCGQTEPVVEHTHEWASAWSKDATKHWKTCSGCEEKKDEATHTYATGVCVCGQISSLSYRWYNASNCYLVTGIGSVTETDIVIPASYNGKPVKGVDSRAFKDCTGLTSVTIPDSVVSICPEAFYGCTGLTCVTIGNGVIDIDPRAFAGCTGLTSITIPDSVTQILDQAFAGCTDLKNVTIGNGVIDIDPRAFAGCTDLKNVTIGNGVTSIGSHMFDGCTGLTSITIPDSVTSIGSHVFDGCTGLTSITIPNSVTSIGMGAFSGCPIETATIPTLAIGYIPQSNLKTVVITSGESIDADAFDGCTGLTSITIPDSVTSIGDYAFYGCTGLTSITIPDSVTSIGKSAVSDCTGLTSVTIGNGVTSIGDSAFSGCRGLTSVTIENGVTSIGMSAFSGCTGLTSIVIPDSVTSIGDFAFRGCTGLTSIVIPDSVKSIGALVFWYCTDLTIYCEVESEPANWDDSWDITEVTKDSWGVVSRVYAFVVWGC